MRYDFECEVCGHQHEHSCPMAARPTSLICPECGGNSSQVFLSVPESFTKFREYRFDKAKNVRSYGASFGRSDSQQHEHYRNVMDLQRKLVGQERRSLKREKEGGIEFLGAMPGEMVDSIGQTEGDPEAVARDPVGFMKRTGTYMGRD